MAFVIKVSHANTLRRLTLRKEDVGDAGIPFASLESRIRESLQIPAASRLSMTYTDAEGDVVTMSTDQDVHDALFQQELNPLRLSVIVDAGNVGDGSGSEKVPAAAAAVEADVVMKQVLTRLSAPEIRKMLQPYEPLFEKVSTSPTQASAFVENLVRNVAAQVATVVKHGADVATSAAAASPFGFAAGQSGLSSGSSSTSTSSKTSESFTAAVAEAAAKAEAAGKQKADVDSVVHSGVSCDMCEMTPIVGLRYKSTKKFNYDLCSRCYETSGKEEDFQKIEQSMFRPRHLHGPGPHRGPPFHPLSQPGYHGRPFGMRGAPFGRHHCHMPAPGVVGKLDSRFVCDVTMFDGTEVAPKANFTKIWRLRNSGAVPWPVRTTLVHVGGDELGLVSMVPLEIPLQGLAPEGEMEVAVDMVAPEKPGRYVSHWRLASPTGPKFGHRIWVVIQVVVPSEESGPTGEDVVQDVVDTNDTNSAPTVEEPAVELTADSVNGNETAAGAAEGESADESVTTVVNVVVPTVTPTENVAKDLVSEVQEKNVASAADLEEGYALVDVEPAANVEKIVDVEQEEGGEIAPDHADGKGQAQVTSEGDQSRITYPKVDGFPKVEEGSISYPVVESSSGAISQNNESAVSEPASEVVAEGAEGESLKTSMAKLQTMGFTNTKLNLELLEKNNLDLRQTLNDLCAVEEWDPILEELEEMGFYDVDVNRRLMFKNNGSVKRVVKELVQMYRNLQDKGRTVENVE